MHIRHYTATAALSLMLGTAQADTITFQSDALPLQPTDWSSFLDLQQFNPTLGTLQSVTVELFSNLVGSIGAENRNPTKALSITLNLKSTVSLLIPSDAGGASLQLTHAATRSFSAGAYDLTMDYAGNSGFKDRDVLGAANVASTFTSDEMLQLFTGTGKVTTSVTAVGEKSHNGNGAFATSFGNNTSAHASVTYTYAAAPVPEPTTWALMIAGLGVVGWLSARRRSA